MEDQHASFTYDAWVVGERCVMTCVMVTPMARKVLACVHDDFSQLIDASWDKIPTIGIVVLKHPTDASFGGHTT